MSEYKKGNLRSSQRRRVTSPAQAKAIAASIEKRAKKNQVKINRISKKLSASTVRKIRAKYPIIAGILESKGSYADGLLFLNDTYLDNLDRFLK